MPVIGLLEGHRLRYRLGDPLITPEAWAQNPGMAYQKDYATTDWEAAYRSNRDAARASYAVANAKSADPEWAPTIEDFFRKYFPTVSFDQPVITSPVDPPMITPIPANEAKAIADAARDAKYMPGPEVRYNPEACGGRAGEITCGPSNATGGGRGNFTPANPASTTVPGTPSKSSAFPILAAIAAYLLVKG